MAGCRRVLRTRKGNHCHSFRRGRRHCTRAVRRSCAAADRGGIPSARLARSHLCSARSAGRTRVPAMPGAPQARGPRSFSGRIPPRGERMKIVIYGLTITSSWGNGHATTYRSLAKALARKGHKILFIEKDVEWYRSNRDLPQPEFCAVRLYEHWAREGRDLVALAADADVVLIGSYFPDAIAAT